MSAAWLIEDGRKPGWYLHASMAGCGPIWRDELDKAASWADPSAAAFIAQLVAGLGYPCSVVRDPRTLGAAPSDSDRPGPRGEATEAGDPSGVADLAGAGGPGTPPREGAAERLAPLPPQLDDLKIFAATAAARLIRGWVAGEPPTGDLEGSEGHSHPPPPTCTGGGIPRTWTAEQLKLFRRCVLCGAPLPQKARKLCSRRCADEHRRRQRFDAETERRRSRGAA